ncbi:Gfo/Idh/MocA family protein [Candidatus Hydrogenedentota bacterium]
MSSTIRVGFVGCGIISGRHLKGLKVLKKTGAHDFKLTALASKTRKHAESFAENVSRDLDQETPDIMPSYGELFTSGKVDAVIVCTMHSQHHTMACEAFEAGLHVAVEKPLAITIKAGQAMIDAANKAGKVLANFENFHYDTWVRWSRWAVESGALGNVQMVFQGKSGIGSDTPNKVTLDTPWRITKLGAGAGITLDGGVHDFAAIRAIAGEIDEVSGLTSRFVDVRVCCDGTEVPNETEDVGLATLRFKNGAVGLYAHSVVIPGKQTEIGIPIHAHGSKGSLICNRENGGEIFVAEKSQGNVKDLYGETCPQARKGREFPKGIDDNFALEQYEFFSAINQNRQCETDGRDGLIDMACAYSIIESATLGRPVKVDDVLAGKISKYQREIDRHYELI